MNKNIIKYLRGISHSIKPVVMIGDKGLTENVMNEIDIALDRHELIKIKIRADRETRLQLTDLILNQSHAEKIQSIGQTLTIFRRNIKNPQYEF